MKTIYRIIAVSLLATGGAWADSQEPAPARGFEQGIAGTTDAETGLSTRTWLREQAEGINRGEVEAYRAESAGKAYRAYSDTIGSQSQQAPTSQVSTIRTN